MQIWVDDVGLINRPRRSWPDYVCDARLTLWSPAGFPFWSSPMSSQPSIRRNVNIRPNAFRTDAPASAPDLRAADLASANLAPKVSRRPITRAVQSGEIFAIPARGLTQPMPMTVGKMLTTKEAAAVLGRPHSTLERWRCEGRGPDYVKEEGGGRYHEDHLREYIRRNTRTSSVRALVETKRESL